MTVSSHKDVAPELEGEAELDEGLPKGVLLLVRNNASCDDAGEVPLVLLAPDCALLRLKAAASASDFSFSRFLFSFSSRI